MSGRIDGLVAPGRLFSLIRVRDRTEVGGTDHSQLLVSMGLPGVRDPRRTDYRLVREDLIRVSEGDLDMAKLVRSAVSNVVRVMDNSVTFKIPDDWKPNSPARIKTKLLLSEKFPEETFEIT